MCVGQMLYSILDEAITEYEWVSKNHPEYSPRLIDIGDCANTAPIAEQKERLVAAYDAYNDFISKRKHVDEDYESKVSELSVAYQKVLKNLIKDISKAT